MGISRRALLGLVAGGLFARALQPVLAAQFSDASGLSKGQFVWQPAVAPEGPVAIVVTARQQVVHVYRAGKLIGIASLKSLAAPARHVAGVFLVADRRREHRDGRGEPRLSWLADGVHVDGAGAALTRQVLALLPDDFASLLYQATDRGAVVMLSEERGDVVRVSTSGMPLLRGEAARTAALELSQRAARPAETAEPMGREAAVVVSLCDRAAHLVRAGVIEATAPVRVAGDRLRTGSFVYTLAGGDEAALHWLAAPIARASGSVHLDDEAPAAVLAGLSFADDRAGLALMHELGRGALLYVTDRPLASALPLRVEMLANRPQPPAAPAVAAGARPGSKVARGRSHRAVRTVEVPEDAGSSTLLRQMFDGPR